MVEVAPARPPRRASLIHPSADRWYPASVTYRSIETVVSRGWYPATSGPPACYGSQEAAAQTLWQRSRPEPPRRSSLSSSSTHNSPKSRTASTPRPSSRNTSRAITHQDPVHLCGSILILGGDTEDAVEARFARKRPAAPVSNSLRTPSSVGQGVDTSRTAHTDRQTDSQAAISSPRSPARVTSTSTSRSAGFQPTTNAW